MKKLNFNDFKTLEKAQKCVAALESEFQMGNGKAGYQLSIIYSEGNTFIPQEVYTAIGGSDKKALDYLTKSFSRLVKGAETGDGECMHLIAMYYQDGVAVVSRDKLQFKLWTEKAVNAGYEGALEDLMGIYGNPKSEFYNEEKAHELRKRIGQ